MSKEYNEVNQSQDHELNYELDKNGLRQTQANRDALAQKLPNNSTHAKADAIITKNKDEFEKKK